MSDRADGGPAFPSGDNVAIQFDSGMSLRDYFAGQALSGFMAAAAHPQSVGITELDAPKLAADAYVMADAMLIERTK